MLAYDKREWLQLNGGAGYLFSQLKHIITYHNTNYIIGFIDGEMITVG